MHEVGITKNITLTNMIGDNAFQRIGVEYNVVLQTRSLVGHTLHTGYTPDTVRIFSEVDYKTLSNARCYAHSDPHTKSFDHSVTFENQAKGPYMLYRNLDYNVEVQTKHKTCYRNKIFCNKAVAIRVDRDVYVIVIDNGHTAFTLCDDAVLAGKVRLDTGQTLWFFFQPGQGLKSNGTTFSR
ncbi:hypothetical protein DPMN_144496 [Dreissena polymorpha]|uniref:Uncharacterized protein n=1 Tax=Dreissena polymorpha TaxID=45954 RepID=A0A9D4GL77_DREPO|nr:hypothetical protein DPMN_144496 [Dreissena polymorpha]